MKSKQHRYRFKIIMLLITAALIAFAFIHSSMTADASVEESNNVRIILQDILNALGINFILTEHIVRKLAHFVEYTLIGAMLMNTAYSFNKSRPYVYYPHILFAGLFTAVIDEAIQLNVAGRSGEITDVLLDFTGIIFGELVMLLILTLHKKIHRIA